MVNLYRLIIGSLRMQPEANPQNDHTKKDKQTFTPLQKSEEVFPVNLEASFSKIAYSNLFFIDKSESVEKLLNFGFNRLLICRPNSFGKSVIVDMIECIFKMDFEPFKRLNCRICNSLSKYTEKFQVVRFSFKKVYTVMSGTYNYCKELIKNLFTHYGIDKFDTFNSHETAFNYFMSQITNNGKKKVVLLIEDIDSVLLKLEPSSIGFNSIVKTIQSIFDVLKQWKKSIHYLFMTCVVNFYNISDLVYDISETKEAAGIFGFTIEEISNSKIFNYSPERKLLLSSTKVFHFSTYQKNLQKIYDNSIKCFNDILPNWKYNGHISIEFLYYIILFFGSYKFSPYSDQIVINPIDFICSLNHSKISLYWLEHTGYLKCNSRNRYHSLFIAFPEYENIMEDLLFRLLFKDGFYSLNNTSTNYKYLVNLGFLVYDGEKLIIPNSSLFQFMTNLVIERINSRSGLSYISYKNSPQNIIMNKFKDYIEEGKLPNVLIENNCFDFCIFLYQNLIFPDTIIKVANDGSFLIIDVFSIISLFFEGNTLARLQVIMNETSFDVITMKLTLNSENQKLNIEVSFKQNNGSAINHSIEYPKPHANSLSHLNSRSNEAKSEYDSPPHAKTFLSFIDLVQESFVYCEQKNEKITQSKINSYILARLPQYASNPHLSQMISISLQNLCEQKKLQFHHENGELFYTKF
ncbi:hypothetical protein TRFO_22352 [Tritrichomonas foetus]|uniref:AAA-ATPase-like domain-containing protein n=1 Tax=Tritrichomonas foetus TaxID=1144522 RepID=A0A1J4KH10_9EUKA|nr:hypothetical protein TRFO_22352 [Tritrichomonas foetus]|eukprot:OHT08934.1 hypothetical protein TRFO_22352 [Tritrichomonas foetus]